MRNGFHSIAFLMCVATTGVFAQTPLQPLWSNTWPYGSGEPFAVLQPGIDNHVSLDPITGNVFVSIDDQDQLFSQRWELLFSFAPDGTEVTPDPVPLLGAWNDPSYPELDLENTKQLEVFEGAALQAHTHGSLVLGGTGRSFVLRRNDGSIWQMSLGVPGVGTDPTASVYLDTDGPVLGGTAEGSTGWLCTVGEQGWPKWANSYADTHPIFDMVVVNGIIYAASQGTVLMVDRSSGELLGQIPISPNAYGGMHLATDGTDLYYAWSNWQELHWGKRSLAGDVIWDHTANDNVTVSEMKVDDLGRIWMSFNHWYPDTGGRLLVSTSDGSAYEQFSYGASINDIDLDEGQAYLTGWADTTTTETYLIAVSTDMNVGRPEMAAPTSITLSPVPASDVLSIDCTLDILWMEVVDATGRAVLKQAPTAHLLNVSALAPGSYSLRAFTKKGTVQQRFSVAR